MKIINDFFLNKRIKIDIIIMFIIIMTPFLFFLYKIAPETQIWKTRWFEINVGYFEDVSYYVWFYCLTFLVLVLLIIWFLTCVHNWRYIIIIPIIIEIFKLYNYVKTYQLGYSYNANILESLPYSIPFVLFLLLLSKKLGYYQYRKANRILINEEINKQLIEISKFDIKDYKEVKKKLVELQNNKHKLEKKQYLIQLIALRDQITF